DEHEEAKENDEAEMKKHMEIVQDKEDVGSLFLNETLIYCQLCGI
ncbi:hypothetical protein Tco_0735830, partial [Tanacetum coccineum]